MEPRCLDIALSFAQLSCSSSDCLFQLGELSYALADYQQALELSPWDMSLQRRVSMLLDKLGMQELRRRCVAVAPPSLPLPAPFPAW